MYVIYFCDFPEHYEHKTWTQVAAFKHFFSFSTFWSHSLNQRDFMSMQRDTVSWIINLNFTSAVEHCHTSQLTLRQWKILHWNKITVLRKDAANVNDCMHWGVKFFRKKGNRAQQISIFSVKELYCDKQILQSLYCIFYWFSN